MMKFSRCCLLLSILSLASIDLVTAAVPPVSQSILYTPTGRLYSTFDARGNRIADFSNSGYKGGGVPLPGTNLVPVKISISPVAGDNRAHIQNAINFVSGLPLDGNGFRGAVYLNAGEYPCSTSIVISASGVVLRGAGATTNGTVLRATGTNQYNLIKILGSGSRSTVSGSTRNITNNHVPVGARSFQVDNASGYTVGDQVVITRPSPANWLQDIYADQLSPPWTAGSKNLPFDRVVTRVEGNWITVDAPIVNSLEQIYGGGTIHRYTWSGRIENCGVEDIYALSNFTSATDENHGWMFVEIRRVRNVWLRNVACRYFGYGLVSVFDNSKWVTVENAQCLDPVSIVTGGRRYSYNLNDAHLVLFTNCFARQGRHDFVWGSLTVGPNAWVDCTALEANSDSGGHYVWAAGMMFDNVKVSGHTINAENKGILAGGDSGWASANCPYWNCEANSFRVQNPPTAQNWLIGAIGNFLTNKPSYAVGPTPPGNFDTLGQRVRPRSLFAVQLSERMSVTNLAYREYWIGDIDNFNTSGANGDTVAVDSAWQTEVAGAGLPLAGFDKIATNQAVPFTITFALGGGEKVVGATLTMMLRATPGGNVTNDVLYLESMAAGQTLQSLGWLPLTTNRAVTVEISPATLQDGKLNVAVLNDVGIDWALLDLRVAPAATANAIPAPPGALEAYPEPQKAFVTWAASLLAESYTVKRAVVSGGPYTNVVTGLATTSFTDTNVIGGTNYFYVVSGVNANGEGGNSAEVSVIPETPSVAVLVARYTFDNNNANDSSGNTHHGTLSGTASLTTYPQRGRVLSLDGLGKVDLGNPAGLNFTGEVSVVCWILNDPGSGNRNILARGFGGSPSREFVLRVDSSSRYSYGTWETGRGDQNALFTIPSQDIGQSNWVHVAGTCTFDGTNHVWRLYRNGVLVSTSATYTNGLLPMTVGWAIGARGGIAGVERGFTGLLDELHIYRGALKQADIQQLMVTTVNSPPAFTATPLFKAPATVGEAYAESIAGDATDPNPGDTLTFARISGPDWLEVASDGSLSGTPLAANLGTNQFTVRATDSGGLPTETTLQIVVQPAPPSAPPVIESIVFDDGNLVLTITDGTPGRTYYILSTTNLALPLSLWPRISTNVFDDAGGLVFTNAPAPGLLRQFFLLEAH